MRSLIRLLLLFLPLVAAAQPVPPPCPASGVRHNCLGTETFANGGRYVGEYQQGSFHGRGIYIWSEGYRYVGEWFYGELRGQGIEYSADGKVNRSGRWSNWTLAESFVVDRDRFPFNGGEIFAAFNRGSALDRLLDQYFLARFSTEPNRCSVFSEYEFKDGLLVGRFVDSGQVMFRYQVPVDSIRILEDSPALTRWSSTLVSTNAQTQAVTVFNLTVEGVGGRRRQTVESVSQDGRVFIKDGLVSGRPSQFIFRCDK